MTAARSSARGHLRFDRRFGHLGVERLQRSSGTKDQKEFTRLNGLLTAIASSPEGAPIIRAFAEELISLEELEVASYPKGRMLLAEQCSQLLARQQTGEQVYHGAGAPKDIEATDSSGEALLAEVLPSRRSDRELSGQPLWITTLQHVIPSLDIKERSKARYATSIRALRHKVSALILTEDDFDLLADLSPADWQTVDAFRTRNLTVEELVRLASLGTVAREQWLRSRRVRIGAERIDRLSHLSVEHWAALQANSGRLIGSQHFEALEHLSESERASLRRLAHQLGEDASFLDLARVERQQWKLLQRSWGASSADWNHVRRALSAVLTSLFHDNPHHAIRRHVIDGMPLMNEVGRVPDLSPTTFWRVMEHVPEYARGFPLALVITALRVGEYEGLEPEHLQPETRTIRVPGTKNDASEEYIVVAPECWAYVERAVPAPFRYGRIRRIWREACNAAGVYGITLHDLRHCHAQWALANGAAEHEVQAQLRHKSIAMTRRYVKTLKQTKVAAAVAEVLMAARPPRP